MQLQSIRPAEMVNKNSLMSFLFLISLTAFSKIDLVVLQTEKDNEKVNYTKDWNTIKRCIDQNDVQQLKMFCTDKVSSIEKLLKGCNELFVKKALDEMSYDQLMKTDQNRLKFYAHNRGINNKGNEYRISLTIFLIKTEQGLRIYHFEVDN